MKIGGGASVESRLRAANHSERILQAGRRRGSCVSAGRKRGMEENRKALKRFLKDNAGRPASWGMSLCEREAKKEKEKTVPTKAEKRANVPEERLEFLRQKEQRKRQRWGDPVSCEGFETHQTKKLKATMLNMTVGDFIELQEWLSLEEKCKLAFLDPDFERIMGGKKEKDSLVARWRIREDIEKANDKILSWAWQNDVPWYGHPPEGMDKAGGAKLQ